MMKESKTELEQKIDTAIELFRKDRKDDDK